MSNSILTVTLNPALDMTGHLEVLNTGHVNQIERAHLHPGGKGVNVARVLADLGIPVSATGWLGKENDRCFVELFRQVGIDDHFSRIDGTNRINVKLTADRGEVTELNFPGIAIDSEQRQVFSSRLFELAKCHELIVIAGSLPAGITPDDLADWTRQLGGQGCKLVLDTSGTAFKTVLAASPWLVKPNEDELSEWAGRPLNTEEELMEAGEAIAAMGVCHVVISRGSKGVLWLQRGRWLKAQPPKIKVVSTVGAGDTLVAGLCYGLNQGALEEEVVAFATALSALAVNQVGVGVPCLKQVDRLAHQVNVSEIKL